MEGVGDEPKAVGPHTPQQLNKGKGEVKQEEEEEVASPLLREDSSGGSMKGNTRLKAHITPFRFLYCISPSLNVVWMEKKNGRIDTHLIHLAILTVSLRDGLSSGEFCEDKSWTCLGNSPAIGCCENERKV